MRPFTEAERQKDSAKFGAVVNIDGPPGRVQLKLPPSRGTCENKVWQFDNCLPADASQDLAFRMIGEPILQDVLQGVHGCIFAYGQTGSGKSHSIFGGAADNRGIVPRLATGLFGKLTQDLENADQAEAAQTRYLVKMSYLEIYNECIRDLLNPQVMAGDVQQSLEVRQHPRFGTFVQDLTENVVHTAAEIQQLLEYGHKIRVVGRTNMNATSSRSHAIVIFNVEQNLSSCSSVKSPTMRARAKLYTVDLAGSERAPSAEGVPDQDKRQQERGQINKSLWALALVISRLSEIQGKSPSQRRRVHIPHRNSKLTHLLADTLSGNCKTAMLACVSPALEHCSTSECTLRFAARVKKIHIQPVQNVEACNDLVGSLRAEIASLKRQLAVRSSKEDLDDAGDNRDNLREKLLSVQKLQEQVSTPWTAQRATSAHLHRERLAALHSLGVNPALSDLDEASSSNEGDPYIMNICDDPLLSGCVTYAVPKGKDITIGSADDANVRVDGLGIQHVMCTLSCNDRKTVKVSCAADGNRFTITRRASLFKTGTARVFVNGEPVKGGAELQHRDTLRIGCTHLFQLVVPHSAEKRRTMHGIIDELTDKDSTEQVLAQQYAVQLEGRIGRKRATAIFRSLKALQPIIDEGNEITKELRGHGPYELAFRSQVLTDVTQDSYTPEILVALRRIPCAGQGLLHGNDSSGSGQLVVVWSVQKFKHQLELMRDLYQEISSRQAPWCHDDLNPWEDGMIDPAPHELSGASELERTSFEYEQDPGKSPFGEVTHTGDSKSIEPNGEAWQNSSMSASKDRLANESINSSKTSSVWNINEACNTPPSRNQQHVHRGRDLSDNTCQTQQLEQLVPPDCFPSHSGCPAGHVTPWQGIVAEQLCQDASQQQSPPLSQECRRDMNLQTIPLSQPNAPMSIPPQENPLTGHPGIELGSSGTQSHFDIGCGSPQQEAEAISDTLCRKIQEHGQQMRKITQDSFVSLPAEPIDQKSSQCLLGQSHSDCLHLVAAEPVPQNPGVHQGVAPEHLQHLCSLNQNSAQRWHSCNGYLQQSYIGNETERRGCPKMMSDNKQTWRQNGTSCSGLGAHEPAQYQLQDGDSCTHQQKQKHQKQEPKYSEGSQQCRRPADLMAHLTELEHSVRTQPSEATMLLESFRQELRKRDHLLACHNHEIACLRSNLAHITGCADVTQGSHGCPAGGTYSISSNEGEQLARNPAKVFPSASCQIIPVRSAGKSRFKPATPGKPPVLARSAAVSSPSLATDNLARHVPNSLNHVAISPLSQTNCDSQCRGRSLGASVRMLTPTPGQTWTQTHTPAEPRARSQNGRSQSPPPGHGGDGSSTARPRSSPTRWREARTPYVPPAALTVMLTPFPSQLAASPQRHTIPSSGSPSLWQAQLHGTHSPPYPHGTHSPCYPLAGCCIAPSSVQRSHV